MRRALLAAAVAGALVAGGCGDDSDEPTAQAKPKAEAKADLTKSPREITCGDLSDPVSRRVTVALANELLEAHGEFAKKHNVLQTSQSIYFGMTELCKSRGEDYKPAEEAVRGVVRGEWEAKL